MRILAFGHKAQQGKSWSCSFLARHLPGRSIVLGFADGLKAYARAGYGMGTRKDSTLLQSLGEGMRQTEPDIWLRVWEGSLEDAGKGIDWVLVPDLRYKNEALFLLGKGALLTKVTRVNLAGEPFVDPSRDPTHVSETDLDDFPAWDYHLVATSVGELEEELRRSFLAGQIPRYGRRTFHLRPQFALGPTSRLRRIR
jgi:hypothetical protein